MPLQEIRLMGFAPDLDPTSPGVMVDCDNLYPSTKGFRPLESLQQFYPALADPCLGAFYTRYLDGTSRLIAGTGDALWLAANGAWTDASGSQTFATNETGRWRFAQFGADTIAVNGNDLPQVITNLSANFVPLAGVPPIASIVETVGNFVFLMNTSSVSNQWWCSGIGDDTEWTPSASTQSANGQLTSTDGPITGARRIGEAIVAFKQRSMYLGTYVGTPVIWQWQLVSDKAGALSHEAAVSLGDRIAFMGLDNFYIFDGSGGPRPIDNRLQRYIFDGADLDVNYAYLVMARYDRVKNCVFWHYPSTRAATAGTIDTWVCWNVDSGQWTRGDLEIEMVIAPELASSFGLAYQDFGGTFATFADFDDTPYNSTLFSGSNQVIQGVFKTDHVAYTYVGQPASGHFSLADIGDNGMFTMIRRARPKFSLYPGAFGFYMQPYKRNNLGESYQGGNQTAFVNDTGWVNFRQAARWHKLKMNFAADAEIMTVDVELAPAGSR